MAEVQSGIIAAYHCLSGTVRILSARSGRVDEGRSIGRSIGQSICTTVEALQEVGQYNTEKKWAQLCALTQVAARKNRSPI